MEILNEVNRTPALMVIIPLGVCVVLFANWFIKDVVIDWLAERSKRKLTRAIDEKEIARQQLETLYSINRDQLHDELQDIINECKNKGYRTTYDTSKFGNKISNYFKIKGNHDGDILKHDFMTIQTLDVMELPIPDGYGNLLNREEYKTIYEVLQKKVKNLEN